MNFSEEVKSTLWEFIDEFYHLYVKSVIKKSTAP